METNRNMPNTNHNIWRRSLENEQKRRKRHEHDTREHYKKNPKNPQSTHREVIYMETGLLDPTTEIERNRINMLLRIERNPSVMHDTLNGIDEKQMWIHHARETCKKYNITEEDISGTKRKTYSIISQKIKAGYQNKIDREGIHKSKVKYLQEGAGSWEPNVKRQYMKKLNRNDCSTIFKARTRMIEVKNNYRNKYRNNICRACKEEEETQEHVLEECPRLHSDESTKTKRNHIFTDDTDTLKKSARQIRSTIKKLIEEI